MERGIYIKNEPDKLMAMYSTIDRKRGTTKLIMVGNTISRIWPYAKAWGIDKVLRRMKPGDIETVTINNKENDVVIAIEYCKSSGGKTMAIGNAKAMIDEGAWQTFPQPHLPKSYNNYECKYRIGFEYQGFRFLGEYLRDKESNEYVWFVYPKYDDFKEKTLIFSDTVKQSIYYQRNIYDITINNEKLRNLLLTFRENSIFYSDDLCGTDFKQAIDFKIRL